MARPAILAVAALVLAGCSTETPLVPAPSYRDTDRRIGSIVDFDPARYAGRWYEIASYPVPFQSGCSDTQAVYGPRGDGTLDVTNVCTGPTGEMRRIDGIARHDGPGRFQVSFDTVPFLTAPYWVLWVDEGYRTAVVGVPSGRAGWILDRDPVISPHRLAAAKKILAFNGYDLSRLRLTPQSGRR